MKINSIPATASYIYSTGQWKESTNPCLICDEFIKGLQNLRDLWFLQGGKRCIKKPATQKCNGFDKKVMLTSVLRRYNG